MNPLIIALAGLGGYIVYEGLDKETAQLPSTPVQEQTTSKFAPITGKVSQNLTATYPAKLASFAKFSGAGIPKSPFFVNITKNWSSSKSTKQTQGAHGQLIDKATKDIKAKFDKLSSSEKKKGADALNKLIKPNPGLTGDEDFKAASKKIGAALGTAAGGAACGPPCASLGAIAGAYLGDKLGDYIKEKWADIESWAADAAKNAGKKIKNAVTDAAKSVWPF